MLRSLAGLNNIDARSDSEAQKNKEKHFHVHTRKIQQRCGLYCYLFRPRS